MPTPKEIKEANEWLEKHEKELPRLDKGGRIGRKKISYFSDLSPERLPSLQVEQEPEELECIGGYAVSQGFLLIATRCLRPIEAYVLSRMCAGLKQREIADETGIDQPNIARMIKNCIRKMQKPIYQNKSRKTARSKEI